MRRDKQEAFQWHVVVAQIPDGIHHAAWCCAIERHKSHKSHNTNTTLESQTYLLVPFLFWTVNFEHVQQTTYISRMQR